MADECSILFRGDEHETQLTEEFLLSLEPFKFYEIDHKRWFSPLTPLMIAVHANSIELLETLISNCDPDKLKDLINYVYITPDGKELYTALVVCCYKGISIHIAKLLLQNGADFGSLYYNRLICMEYKKLFIEYGADINHKYDGATTYLFMAIVEEDIELIKFLLEHGADVNMKYYFKNRTSNISFWLFMEYVNEGMTIFDLAQQKKNKKIMKILEEYSGGKSVKAAFLNDNH